jgi:outer membrane receptor protein involved in Fe transport
MRHPRGRPLAAGIALLAALIATPLASTATAQTGGAPPPPVPPASTGRITGKVLEKDGNPVAYSDVRVLGGPRVGAMTDDHGVFVLVGVPAGTWQVQASPTGFEKQVQTVTVNAGATSTVTFTVGEAKIVKQLPEFEVRGEAKKVDTKSSTTKQSLTAERLRELPVDNLRDAVSTRAGVVASSDGLHVRGGRADEVKLQIEGVEVSDVTTNRGANIATLAVANTDVLSGGFDAEYGNALSGVINVSTKEGTDRFGGEARWDTDRYGDATKTYDDYDRFTFGFGGPTPIRNLTYYATYEGTWSDTYLKSSFTRPSRTFFDFLQFGNRQSNQINTNLKFAYRLNSSNKITLETINNRTIDTPYNHMWSREGFVQLRFDTSSTGTLTPRYGTWSFTRLDSSFVPENMPDHVPTTDDRYRQFTTVWSDQISDKTALTTRLTTFTFDTHTAVQGKQPWEYDTQSPFYWIGNTQPGTENNLYYATHGDFPAWSRVLSTTSSLKADFLTRHWRNHTFKTGIDAKYNSEANLAIAGPNLESNGLPGQVRSDFTNYNPEGAAYAQDRWEFEGLVLNAGMRYDMFTPGLQVSDADLKSGQRYKQQVSPRLGIAYPISDKDVLSFFYGWTYQTPAHFQIYNNRGVGASVITQGNPDLQPETNISYQAGMQHLFSRDVAGQFSVFFKDIYGLITLRQQRDEFGNLVNVFTNGDYASARGFEASISKSFSHKFSAEMNYSYQIATGVASNPLSALQFFNGGQLYLPISEQPLDWDQRSTLSLQAVVRDPGKWGFRMLWSYGSGFPFTPTYRNDRKPDPMLTNSRRLPSSSRLTIDGDKFYRVWGQNVTLFFDARNVLNAVTIESLVQNSFPNNNVDRSGGPDYLIYYTETGRAGGAYLQDVNGDGVDDWVPVHDPRVFQEGRDVRLGVSVAF